MKRIISLVSLVLFGTVGLQARTDNSGSIYHGSSIPAMVDPAKYVCNFAPFNRRIVAPEYRQQVRDFIKKLTSQELAAILTLLGGNNGKLEMHIATSPEYCDATVFKKEEERLELFLNNFNLLSRPGYKGRSADDLLDLIFTNNQTVKNRAWKNAYSVRDDANQAAFKALYPTADTAPNGTLPGDSFSEIYVHPANAQ